MCIRDSLKTAREYLHAAGYRTDEDAEGSTLELTLMVPADRDASYRVEAAKAIKKQLKRVGVEITIEELTPEEFLGKLNAKDYQLAFVSYYLDENPDLSFMFNSGGTGNYNGVSNQELTDAIAAAGNAFTEESVQAAYSELQKVLMERVPQIGLYYRMNSIICDEAITGITGVRQNTVFGSIDPVSYTHLSGRAHQRSGRAEYGIVYFYRGPVSYTHLDVYKRQYLGGLRILLSAQRY